MNSKRYRCQSCGCGFLLTEAEAIERAGKCEAASGLFDGVLCGGRLVSPGEYRHQQQKRKPAVQK